ncbi:heterocyst formation ABC transporter subunit HepA [Acaryochloris sp. IP29b_bin.137]|uniref:heterocyst formation ABC transporter subunit HepA n=1 Tax=Acaryochloris sp. IP29b_bin.137 TaxID=2969217 RepID=UPI002610C456|nr:heterocyst formation ABC transporter subunit HepA [Acaryochloris sp. IP29b_bin.137]
MLSKFIFQIKELIKNVRFWRENHLILRELKHIRWLVFLSLLFSLIAALSAGLTIGSIGVFLQSLAKPDEFPIRTGFDWFDVHVLATRAPVDQRIYRIAFLILLMTWIQSAFQYFSLLYSKLTAFSLVDRIHKSIFEQLQSLSLSFFFKKSSGELINILRGETDQIQHVLISMSMLVTQGFTMLVYVALMLTLSWQLFLGALVGFSLLSVVISKITSRVREASFDVPAANKQLTSIGLEFIDGIRTVHSCVTQEYERQRFYRASQNVLNARAKVGRLAVAVQPLTRGMAGTMLIVMVAFAFNSLVRPGHMRTATLLTFLVTLSRTMPLLTQINGSLARMSSFQGSFNSVSELLRRDNKQYLMNGSQIFSQLTHSIDFIAVDFSYHSDEVVLKDITLSIKKGQTTALVGSSGAGKSTLAELIPRFFDPSQGSILIDGVDLRDLDINSFRSRMAIVSQDTFIFNTSVRDNIAYGLDHIDEDLILEVARQAGALDFILELPHGFDTNLGDRGTRLSGGQRQRIAIARALLRNPEILILDEATSALDSETERVIQESLAKLAIGRTVIAIAHRLSTIAQADKVVVLEQGCIVEQGRYQNLLERRGLLWKYHQMQYDLSPSS